MAKGEITIRQEARPCRVMVWVKDPDKENEEQLKMVDALWHAWRNDGREAIVELENGMVRYISPDRVQFLDSEEKFREFAWPAKLGVGV